MEHSFSIHWGAVSAGKNRQVYALWPTPMNEDVCFEEAGVTHFKYEDENWSEQHWDEKAEILQYRLITVFSYLGAPTLLSEPLLAKRSLEKFWAPGKPLPLIEQLRWPVLDDNLPEVVIRFGDAIELRARSGHELYWISLSSKCSSSFDELLAKIAGNWPTAQLQLDWDKLGYGREVRGKGLYHSHRKQ
jgi:hypothetical protein